MNISVKKHLFSSITALFTCIILAIISMAASVQTADAAELTDRQVCEQVFDASYYAQNNADVVAAVGNSKAALLKHYMQSGIYEGRNASAFFNATSYKNRYSDLKSAFGEDMMKYVRHYVTCGKSEGRVATPSSQNTAAEKNVSGYQFLGSYTTSYNPSQARATNISIGASKISGTVVAAGAEFSFSNTVGPRTVENGFVEAPVFINKEHAMGIGGGICQVSSTLYAAMRTIGLPATERHAHSLPVDYVPEGWDATISGTTLDFKFVNTYSKPLLITASADSGKLTVSLYLKN